MAIYSEGEFLTEFTGACDVGIKALVSKGKQKLARLQKDVIFDSVLFNQPLYFVLHPDNTYSIADPQPRLAPPKDESVERLRFLLSQAPMLNAPEDVYRASKSVVPYAYVHPKTFAEFTCTKLPEGHTHASLSGSLTIWVFTELMPEGSVIYSPNRIPGFGPDPGARN